MHNAGRHPIYDLKQITSVLKMMQLELEVKDPGNAASDCSQLVKRIDIYLVKQN